MVSKYSKRFQIKKKIVMIETLINFEFMTIIYTLKLLQKILSIPESSINGLGYLLYFKF